MNKKILLSIIPMMLLLVTASVGAQSCPSGTTPTDVETVTVLSDGSSVQSTNNLENGVTYLLEASGTANAGGNIYFDAEYSTRSGWTTWQDGVLGYESLGEDLLDLKVNNEFVDWGAYNEGHTYWWSMVGDGTSVELQIYDTYPSNNVGNLTVDIYKCVDITAPIITFVEPVTGSTHSGVINLRAECNEVCNYVNFWWRAEGEVFAWYRYHYVHDNGTVFEWGLNTLNAQLADGDSYIMVDGTYYLYAAGKDLAGNWARTSQIQVTVDNTAPIVTINSPSNESFVKGTVNIYGSIIEAHELSHYNIFIYPGNADFMDFSKRLEGKTVYQSSGFNNQPIYEWDTTEYEDGWYLIRLAARDKAGNRDLSGNAWLGGDDSQHVIKVFIGNTKAGILKYSGVPGKGLETAPGLQKPFNPESQAAKHAGKKK